MESQTINLISAGATVVAAVAATIAAWGARAAARETKRAVEAQLLATFLDQYSEPRMHTALDNLRSWVTRHPDASQWSLSDVLEDEEYIEVDRSRRIVRSYFDRVVRLRRQRYITKSFVEEIVRDQGIKILFEIIEPLEQATGKDFDSSTYDALRRYYKK